jgi:Tol biopolymer transport system component
MSLAGGESEALTGGPFNDASPTWSPDGSRLAFWSDRSGNGDIYVMTIGDTAVVQVATDEALDASRCARPRFAAEREEFV